MKLEPRHIAAVVSAGLVPDADTLDDDSKHDAALDALLNEAPEIRGWEAVQDNGQYSITLRSALGANFASRSTSASLGVGQLRRITGSVR